MFWGQKDYLVSWKVHCPLGTICMPFLYQRYTSDKNDNFFYRVFTDKMVLEALIWVFIVVLMWDMKSDKKTDENHNIWENPNSKPFLLGDYDLYSFSGIAKSSCATKINIYSVLQLCGILSYCPFCNISFRNSSALWLTIFFWKIKYIWKDNMK